MSDSRSASLAMEAAMAEMKKNDCPKASDGRHAWNAPCFYGAKKCSLCERIVYTK